MLTLINIYRHLVENNVEYKGTHTAPTRESGSPLYDVTKNGGYPEDIYSSRGYKLYGFGDERLDYEAWNIIMSYRNKPNKLVTIYRAVPKVMTNNDWIKKLIKDKAYILKYGRMPNDIPQEYYQAVTPDKFEDHSAYYDWAWDELHRREAEPPEDSPKMTINPGDWVTITRGYAIHHGKSNLNGKYRILSKKVPANEVYTEADDLNEWGWNP